MIFGSNRKNGGILSFGGKRSCLKRIRGYDTGKKGCKIRNSFVK